MTPERDTLIRQRAQQAYAFAVAELERTDEPLLDYGAVDWEERHARRQARHATPEYAQTREYRSWLYANGRSGGTWSRHIGRC